MSAVLRFNDFSITPVEKAMSLAWVDWSNPVAIWWICLAVVSAGNVAALSWLASRYRRDARRTGTAFSIEPLLLFCAFYVLVCAFRSAMPRADVQRICLFDTWLSSVMVGRSVATVAELCFAAQWAIVLRTLGRLANSDTARGISRFIVPLIAVAECCSWYAVITTSYLGNVAENSIWTLTFALVAIALIRLVPRFRGALQLVIAGAAIGGIGYVIFMGTVDVPMYFTRWLTDQASGKHLLGLFAGLHDLATHWVVTHDIADWRQEIAWMSLYFSIAVWTSLTLASVGLVKHQLPRFVVRAPRVKATRQPPPVTVRF
jgi:hypothetical protein